LKLLWIKWRDPVARGGRWTAIEDVNTVAAAAESVGWLARQTAEDIIIVQTSCIDKGEDEHEILNEQLIPRGCIVEMQELTLKEQP